MPLKPSKFGMLSVDEVELDISNPRIAKWVEMYGDNIEADHIGMALGAGDPTGEDTGTTFRSLRESIRTNKGVIHPIVVNREPNGRLLVIEGNTRTFIYLEFRRKGVEGDWSQIPAIVYENLSPQEIDAIRLQSHMVGPRAWDAYSKAKYLQYLHNAEHLTINQVIDFCGGRRKDVMDYIDAFEDMEEHYRPLCTDEQFDTTRFSSFVELQDKRINDALLESGYTKADFAKWVRDGLLMPQRHVRDLPRILENPRAREIFVSAGAADAVKAIDVPTPDTALSEAGLLALAAALNHRILAMQFPEIQALPSAGNESLRDALLRARDVLVDLCGYFEETE